MATEDRRTRRTRRALRDALVSLVIEHGYAGVKVEDITEHADLSRATFYGYYTDKDDLLDTVVSDLLVALRRELRPLFSASSEGFTGKPLLKIFQHAQEERDLYRLILRGEGDGRALRQFTEVCTRAGAELFRARAEHLGIAPRLDPELLTQAWAGEWMAVLAWWIEADSPALSPEQATEMLLSLSLRGRYWAAGFDSETAPGSP
ncbi:TetR/AcrR family transcriptional regulator [Streptomyces albipurpureus]|uniref:TetR/AcrR family transcriptional regulator n=1 Tax=Streptomyces albipurpureus TaxID=2897419 RepID=A0ABT0V1E6_9ACTN|nr:TetR/AcrR family transcriptional regulator [Streptomyces sp. CWNU-1]MCM2393398.1 TetR/AcrR family transcriptional regulator [Streptomyces sp. CWNU-1]